METRPLVQGRREAAEEAVTGLDQVEVVKRGQIVDFITF